MFRYLWLAAVASALGDGMRWVALPLLAVRQSADPWTISLITATEQLPWLLFGLVGGVLADRYDRRNLIRGSDLVRAAAVAAFAVAVWLDATPIAVIAALGFVLTCGDTVAGAAFSALVPALVAPEGRAAANGRLQAGVQVTDTLIGTPAGAALFAAAAVLPFALDAVSFLASALFITLCRPLRDTAPPSPVPLRRDLTEGLRLLWTTRTLRALCLLQATTFMGYTALLVVLVLFAGQVLHLGPTGFGLLVAVFAVGGVGGGLLAGPLTARVPARQALLLAVTGSALCAVAFGLSRSPVTAGVVALLFGTASALADAIGAALRQNLVPDAYAGRVTSAFRLVAFALSPVAALGAGALADAFGLRAPFLAAAAVITAGLLTCARPLLEVTARHRPATDGHR